MPPLSRLLGLLLLVLLTRCQPSAPEIDCSLSMVAQMPLQVQSNLLVVPVGINGKWVHLVVDSGAERTTISEAAANRLGLPRDAKYVTHAVGVGGATTTTDVTIDRMVIGGVHFPVNRVAVGTFSLQNDRGLNADGLLGADILLAFDMDIDVPGGTLSLYHSRVCPNAKPPWHGPSIEIQGVRALKDRLLVPIELDGASGMAILDTGAEANVLGVDMVRRIGLTEQDLLRDPPVRNQGTGGVSISRLHRFRRLRIGPVVEEQPEMIVMQSDFGVGDALIGESFLRGRRVWLSFRGRQIFVSPKPNGE